MNTDFVVTISSTDGSDPVHIVLPVGKDGEIVREDVYVLVPVGIVVPEQYSVVLEEALQALEITVRFLVEGKKPKRKGPSDEQLLGPSLN